MVDKEHIISDKVESTRPTLYRSLKYWGKKPHNVWRELIEENSSPGDVIYDPFAGSGLTFFESVKLMRKPVVCDVNPLTLFLIKTYSQSYNIEDIKNRVDSICSSIRELSLYKKHYVTKCEKCNRDTEIYNYRWEKSCPKKIVYKCNYCGSLIINDNNLKRNVEGLNLWKPHKDLSNFSSFSQSSAEKFGSSDISAIWSDLNIELLSFIFSEILNSDAKIRDALMFGFLQTLHLTTKMCATRSDRTNRPLSTSWGRPAYMALNKFMEQNPLIQFCRSIYGNNGVIKALLSRQEYLPDYKFSESFSQINNVDGAVLINNSKNVSDIKAKLIITDPPYGSLIQYGELSFLWNVWLNKYNSKYSMNLEDEIIVNNKKDYRQYVKDLIVVFNNCYKILDKDGVMIFTFNSDKENEWKIIKEVLDKSKFTVSKEIYQKNLRSSESNVIGNTMLSNSDYYLILKK